MVKYCPREVVERNLRGCYNVTGRRGVNVTSSATLLVLIDDAPMESRRSTAAACSDDDDER